MKYLLFLALLLHSAAVSAKEAFSYLYIQGDKQTPFYVKLEDAMQPRYGKNYCIIPQLAAGPAHIEILFQQNAFPAQKFTVLIPEQGSRGFLLVKKDDGFSLYDLQQGFYLPAGNTEADDKLPTGSAPFLANAAPVERPLHKEPQQPVKTIAKKDKPKAVAAKTKNTNAARPVKPANTDPVFIPGIELPKTGDEQGGSTSVTASGQTPVAIANSDCPAAISSAEFSKIFNAMSANAGDEERLGYVMGKMDVCYESWQARALAQMLTGDAARFTLLKRIYPRIADQGAFPLLDDLLTGDTWKAEFAKLVRR